MKLYHGSRNNLQAIRKSQAQAGEGIDVPEGELLEAIYLTPSYKFAFAAAARVDGVTHIDDKENTIEFENPELFDPEREVYVYEVDIKDVPKESVRKVDELQYAILNLDEIKPTNQFIHKAGEIQKYYKLKNWDKGVKEADEAQKETNIIDEFKLK
jgi:hypothetical protein